MQYVLGSQPGDPGVGAGSEQQAVPMRQTETLVEFQGVVGCNGSRLRITVGLNDMLSRSSARIGGEYAAALPPSPRDDDLPRIRAVIKELCEP